MDLVSICIPTYNGAEFLEDCVRSALAQTYTNLEILLVDDGSQDDTLALSQALARQDPRIRCIPNERNLGLVGNWNRCIALAKGEWIKFLFQDDLIAPQCVDALLRAADQKVLLVACDRDFLFAEDTDPVLVASYERNRQQINAFLAPRRGATAAQYAAQIHQRPNYNFIGEPTVTLIRRSAFERYGLFDPGLMQICDLEYWCRIASQEGLSYVPQALATFRVHGGATSARNRGLKAFQASGLEAALLLKAFLQSPTYAELRQHWQRAGHLRHVEQLLFRRNNQIKEHVWRSSGDRRERDALQQAYRDFLDRHPDCHVSWPRHLNWLWQDGLARQKHRLGQWWRQSHQALS